MGLTTCTECGAHVLPGDTCPGCGTGKRSLRSSAAVARAGRGGVLAAALLGTTLACGTGDRTRNGDTGPADSGMDSGPQPAYGVPADVAFDTTDDSSDDAEPPPPDAVMDTAPVPDADVAPQPAYGIPPDAFPD